MSHRITARFEIERHRQLTELFTSSRLIKVWRDLGKQQMRNFPIADLHDYYDFNYAIEIRVEEIIERVLSGYYHAEAPLIYRTEKKYGVCRHMMIPTPSDVLVFQVLTDCLYAEIKKAQPSEGAYYSRDKHALSLPHSLTASKDYPWFILWPKFQKEIWNFTKNKNYLVTTDISNYFDNIGLRELRHVISSIIATSEVYLDLLFSLIENLSWNPDYLPNTQKGLPTIGIEAPRLLSHAFLFEIDHILKSKTDNNFVRWMDDINFSVDDPKEAKCILGEINNVMKSRGLALNLAKTEIMTSEEAEKHFMFNENLHLDKLNVRIAKLKDKRSKVRHANNLADELSNHVKTVRARNADMITKRYLTTLSKLKIPVALEQVCSLYVEKPDLRNSVLIYLKSLPFDVNVGKVFIQLLKDTNEYDDATRYILVATLTEWAIPRNSTTIHFVKKITEKLENPQNAFEWLCQITFLAKYGEAEKIATVAENGKKFKDPFFARQRVAALTRVLETNHEYVISSWKEEVTHGYNDSASVAINLLNFSESSFPSRKNKLSKYLFPDKQSATYPLPKFLILCALAHSESKLGNTIPRPIVQEHILDEWYVHALSRIQQCWF